jgi:hypothetical protein
VPAPNFSQEDSGFLFAQSASFIDTSFDIRFMGPRLPASHVFYSPQRISSQAVGLEDQIG